MDEDDARHRRDEGNRKEKRRLNRENKSASQREKEKTRAAHIQKTLQEVNSHGTNQPRPPPPSRPHQPPHKSNRHRSPHSKSRPPPPPSAPSTASSKFQSLFSKRAEGFLIDLQFRNAPPRPPVGPCFVGLGLDGELNDKWTRYKPDNAIERQYVWKLHAEPDLGVPLAPSAMDYEGCYFDPTRKKKKPKNVIDDNMDVDSSDSGEEEDAPVVLPTLHPDDAKLIDWTGDTGDSVLKELQNRRQRARALLTHGGLPSATTTTAATASKNKLGVVSRVLREVNPFFMKKTTYIANDQSKSIHSFKSLEKTKTENAKEIRRKLEENRRKLSGPEGIMAAFVEANANRKGKKRKHPVKRDVEAMYEIPFLPDATTWGHTYTHVVMDHLPKKTAPGRKGKGGKPVGRKMLERAFIADVTRSGENVRMECNVLLPEDAGVGGAKQEGDTFYDAALAYNVDLVPLKEEGVPCVNFLLTIDEKNSVATYHPVGTKVQLSTGRRPGGSAAGGRKRLGRHVGRREMGSDDVEEMEGRLGEIDRDFGDQEEYEVEEGNNGDAQKSQSRFGDEDSDSDDYE